MKLMPSVHVLEGLRSGCYADFNNVYDAYADLLYGFVFKLTKSESLAKDIVQETFLRIWRGRSNINLESPFKAYLFAIARNLVTDTFRTQVKKAKFEQYIQSEAYQRFTDNEAERQVSFDEFMLQLDAAKAKLTERQREIFELSREYGHSVAEIADQLQLSQQTVKNQLSKAMKVIRGNLSPRLLLLFAILFN